MTVHNGTADASERYWKFVYAAKESLACGSAFYFDPRGDLILSVGEAENEVCDFVVCSRTVARGSKVFNTMLFGGFAESAPSATAPDGSWTVKLPDDQMAPFFLILAILHGNYQVVPRSLEEQELYELLVMTEKYDMTHILRPWAKCWFEPLADYGFEPDDKQRMMWIAWELGHTETFYDIAMNLMLSSCVDDTGQLLADDGVPLSSNPCREPPGIFDSIKTKRAELLVSIEGFLRSVIKGGGSKCSASTRNSSHGHSGYVDSRISATDCNDLFVGSFIRRIREIGLEEVALLSNTSPPHRGRINDISETMRRVKAHRGVSGHENCDPWAKVEDKLRALIGGVSYPVTQLHDNYLGSQALKTGIEEEEDE